MLDVILAIGDLIDYIFEDDDDPAGGGNDEFLRKLILGQAPGPTSRMSKNCASRFSWCPATTTTGSIHTSLSSDLQVRTTASKRLRRVKNFPPYHLMQADALALANALAGRPSTPTSKTSARQSAARMVEVDPEIKGYRAFLRSHVVHRAAW